MYKTKELIMNKTLLLIARILSLITGIIWCFTIIFIPIGILNIIASNKFSEAEKGNADRETVRNWSIYLLLLIPYLVYWVLSRVQVMKTMSLM